MIKRMVIMLVAVAIVFGGIFGFQVFKGMMIKKFITALSNPPQTVSAAKAETSEWQPKIEAIGSLRAVKGADLSLEVSGVVEAISFNSGDDVAEGAPLLKLRTADDVARLEQLEAMADLSDITYERDQKQFKMQAVSQATIDTDAANLKNARAQVAQQQAIIDKKLLRAPFAGHLGIRAVDLGQYLGPGTVIVTLQALDPITSISTCLNKPSFRWLARSVGVKIDAFKDQTSPATFRRSTPRWISASRNVQVRATFANADRRLIPGMYANVDIENGEATTQITLPQTAITYNPYGDTVYLVKERHRRQGQGAIDGAATFVSVTRAATRSPSSGVAAGDKVVTAGQMKLRNGSPIVIDNKITPTADAAPVPVDR